MTTETLRPSGWDRAAMLARWCRDHLGAFIATFGMILVLFGISALLTYAFLQLDYHFSRPLAGDVIPPEVTQAVAWGTRLFTLVAGSLAIYFHVNEMPKWRNGATVFGAIGAILLMLHAYGVAAKIMEGQYAATRAVERVAGADVSTVGNQIADIDAAMIRAASDRDTALTVAQQTIDSVKDQVVGLSAADNLTIQKGNADKAAALAAYDAKVAELDAQKKALRASEGQATQAEAQSTSIVQTFNPLFTFLARLTSLNFDPAVSPPDGHKYVWGAVFFTLFFGFGELALMFCLTGAFAALKVVSERKMRPEVRYSEDIPEGMTRWEGTAEEWDEIEAALAVHRNIKTGAKKGARTKRLGNKIEAETDYYRARISMFMDEHNRGLSTSEIAAKHGMTVAVMRMSYGPYMSPEESAALFPVMAEPEPETPEEPAAEPEQAEPEEPKDYPVDFPRKDKPNGAADGDDIQHQ